jgi:hypothetical protein
VNSSHYLVALHVPLATFKKFPALANYLPLGLLVSSHLVTYQKPLNVVVADTNGNVVTLPFFWSCIMSKVITTFYERKTPIHQIQTDYPLSISEGDTVRIHAGGPTQYVVDEISHEITIDDKSLTQNVVQIHLTSE